MRVASAPHGADVKSFARKYGVQEESVLDFSNSVSPLGLPPSAAAVYSESLREIGRYPDPQARDLCREIAAGFGLTPAHVLAGNGAVSLLELAIRAVRARRALLLEPCFTEYRRLLEIHSCRVASESLKAQDGFAFPLEKIKQSLKRTDLLVLGHPNNPTGTALPRSGLLELAGAAKRHGVMLLVDEAFCDWCPEGSIAAAVSKNTHLIVVRSLTKFYGLAGIRAGFALASKGIIRTMKGLQETWSCNALAQKLALAVLRDEDFKHQALAWFKNEKACFFAGLNAIPGLTAYPSLANFFLLKVRDRRKVQVLARALTAAGLYVRGAEGFRGLDKTFLRVSLRMRNDNDRLLGVIAGVLAPQQNRVC